MNLFPDSTLPTSSNHSACMIASSWIRPLGQIFFQSPVRIRRPSHVPLSKLRPVLPHSPGRSFSSSACLAMHILPSAEQNILSFLRHQKHERWGWVIYRCTYNDDEAWDRFKDFVDQQSRQFIAESDTPEIADSLEWTFIENRDTLDNASKDQLRAHFKKWAADAVYAENPRYEERQNATFGIPRYSFFIQVDEDSLRSVLNEASQPPGHYDKLHDDGYVNFVNAHWKSLLEHIPPNQLTGDLEEDIGGLHEPIDGCCEEDVGWMKLESMGLSAGFYDAMTGYPDIWYAYYERPPQIARI